MKLNTGDKITLTVKELCRELVGDTDGLAKTVFKVVGSHDILMIDDSAILNVVKAPEPLKVGDTVRPYRSTINTYKVLCIYKTRAWVVSTHNDDNTGVYYLKDLIKEN